MIYLLPAKADMLLDIMYGTYDFSEEVSYESEEKEDEAEIYHWDNLYLCTYCYDTEVIIDPYGLEE